LSEGKEEEFLLEDLSPSLTWEAAAVNAAKGSFPESPPISALNDGWILLWLW
jgi:hypothetical protein